MTFMACSRMSLRAVSDALRAAEASSSTNMEATDSLDRLSRAVASRDLHSSRQWNRRQARGNRKVSTWGVHVAVTQHASQVLVRK